MYAMCMYNHVYITKKHLTMCVHIIIYIYIQKKYKCICVWYFLGSSLGHMSLRAQKWIPNQRLYIYVYIYIYNIYMWYTYMISEHISSMHFFPGPYLYQTLNNRFIAGERSFFSEVALPRNFLARQRRRILSRLALQANLWSLNVMDVFHCFSACLRCNASFSIVYVIFKRCEEGLEQKCKGVRKFILVKTW